MYDLRSLWGRIKEYVFLGVTVSFVIASLGWYTTSLKLDSERAAREVDKKTYQEAQASYEAKALREKIEIEKRNVQRAEQADADYDTLLSKYNAALLRRQRETLAGSSSGHNLPISSSIAEGSYGSSEGAELPAIGSLTISMEDASICAVNTARLVVIHEWSKGQPKD